MANTLLGGRYQTVRVLGAGGMGRVYQAVDTSTGRAVAAKVLIPSPENKLESLLRFQQEGAVLSTLKHPNIVEVYGTFLEADTCCIIMELLEGRSLAQILRVERLPLDRTRHIMIQVASALDFAHSQSIIHRDVKPDNVMIVGNDHVKVTDFGIARVLRTGATLNTAVGTSIGTPLYMAPEQIEGQKVDSRADIYAFGAVMYECVTGHPPFEGEDPLTVAFKHVHTPPQPPSEVADVPQDWEALILRALAKDPGERFQTAASLEQALAALGSDGAEPLFPPRPLVMPRLAPKTREANGKATPAPVPAPAPPPTRSATDATGPATGVLPAFPEAPVAPPAAPPRAGGPTKAPWAILGGVGGVIVLAVVAFLVLHKSGSSPTPTPTSGPTGAGTLSPIAVWGSSGSGSGQFNAPSGITVDDHGDVYVADSGNNRVLKLSSTGQQLASFGASGASGVAVGSAGNIFVADGAGGRVGKLSAGGKLLTSLAGFKKPLGLAFGQGSLYVADAGNGSVEQLSPRGNVLGGPWNTGSGSVQLNSPSGIAVDSSGNMFIADTGNNRIQELASTSDPFHQWGTKGSGPVQFVAPQGVAVDSQGRIFVADTGNNRVQELSPDGRLITQWGGAGSANGRFSGPKAIAVDASGHVYVADTGNNRVQVFAPPQGG